MTTLQAVARTLLAFAVLFDANMIVRADDSENKNIAPGPNRLAIIIDASNDSTDQNNEAIEKFRDALIASGIHEKNALIYSASSDDPVKRPTREILEAIANGLRGPDFQDSLPGKEQILRDSDAACEAMVFLTGLGVANDATGEAYLAPAGVDESQIKDWNDPQLFPLGVLEDELFYAEKGQNSYARIFFVVALNSPKPATRNASGEITNNLKSVDLTRLPTRGTQDGDAENVAKYAHYRVATKNARFDDHMIGSFYNTLRDGLEGAADVAGNQNGTVSADELVDYLEKTAFDAENTIVVVRSGNDEYPLCETQKKLTITSGLFEDLAKTFTRDEYKEERENAAVKAETLKALAKKGADNATKGAVVK